MAEILIPIPARDFDPTEAAVGWQILRSLGHTVTFATPAGETARADEMMVSGQGLDPWGFIPVLRRFPLVGLLMRADRNGRRAYAAMTDDPRFKAPLKWAEIDADKFDGLLLPGGHRARGMRPYLENPALQRVVAAFFEVDKPVAAICHGVLLVARSISKETGRSVLHGRKTTALTWALESAAASVGRIHAVLGPVLLPHLSRRSRPDSRLHVGASRGDARPGKAGGFSGRARGSSPLSQEDQRPAPGHA